MGEIISESAKVSMNGDFSFFEGVEKLMEIWFTRSDVDVGTGDARTIIRSHWERILERVHCKIIDAVQSEEQIAYLLSESSLFISKHRIILKTCGTTLCLQALPHILQVMEEQCGFDVVADFFYSRKNFMKPDHQPHPHKTFHDEIVYLDKLLSASASYCLGRMDGDCWFLYTLNHAGNSSLVGVCEPDQTLEILMTELDPIVMSQFVYCDENGNKHDWEQITKESGIGDLIPQSKLNASLFDPCGYSLNGLLSGVKNGYWTIHITPESDFSYVSFETNLPSSDYTQLIKKVTEVFKPGRFTMTLFANHTSPVDTVSWNSMKSPSVVGFKQLDKQIAQLQDYSLFYTNYKKMD